MHIMYDDSMMMDKHERQSAIAALIREHPIRTQADLSRRLADQRMVVDQSTLSRDLTELGIQKAKGCYAIPDGEQSAPKQLDLAGVVQWFTPCGPHMIVVTTLVGQAQPVALVIEGSGESAFLATLAGDDTVFLATKSARTQAVALRRLEQWFGDKRR